MVKINKICSIQGSSVENEDAVGSQNQYFWIIDGATDLYNSKEEIGYSVSEVVHILSESLSVNCKESKTLKQIFETALLEVKDEIGLNSYELTEYYRLPTFAFIFAKLSEKKLEYMMLGDCVMLVNEMEITDHRVDNLFEKGKNEIKDSIGTNSVLNKKIIFYFHLELNYFDKDYLYSFLKKVILGLFVLHILSFISDMVSTHAHFNSFGSILATIVFICLLLIFFAMNANKVQVEKEIALKQKKFEQEHLQTYTDEIVGLYNEIRGFRHDYAGMLVSMQMAIDSKDLQEIDRIYNEVLVKANQKLRSDKYTYFDLNNIEDSALRSLIAQSIVYARNNDVEFTLEVKDIITRLSIDLLDLVRIMSVLLNNAVEGAAESYLKQMEVAVIKMDLETVIVIQNSCKITMIPSEDLFELGFSTKGRNRGIGLNNVKEILDKYENIILETEMEDSTFRQIIRFKREFE